AVVKRYYDDKQLPQDLPFAQWSMEHALFEVERALLGVLDNFPSRFTAGLLRFAMFPLGAHRRPPSDELGGEVSRAILEGDGRERLTADMYLPDLDEPGIGRLEYALMRVLAAGPAEKKVRHLVREKKIAHAPMPELAEQARRAALITEQEFTTIVEAERARRDAIEVDAFDRGTLGESTRNSVSTITRAARFTGSG
ncbi:MAG: acyl-CoA dehydrogenase domain-containing protein, partial [Polyangiaceae bacterium]